MNHADRQPLIAARAFRFHAGPGALVARLFGLLIVWNERQRQRYRLHEMSDRDLRDIGLSRSELERERRKPFWRS